MTFKKSFVAVAHKHSNLFRKHAGASNQLNASNAQLQDRARAMSHIRQLERQEIEQKPHPPLSAPTLNFGAPCHDFSSHGRERSESFLLLSMPREDMLTHAKEFGAKLFQKDQLLAQVPELLACVNDTGSDVPGICFHLFCFGAETILKAHGHCKFNKAA